MSAGGKGHAQRPTDQAKFSSGYDNIKWTKEEDEEFERITEIQDGSSTQRTLAQARSAKETLPPA
jgi:hypothetical protein